MTVSLLYGVANFIRLLWKQHVVRTKMVTFSPSRFTAEDRTFQDYITDLVRHRFPAAGALLHTQLGESIVSRRRTLLNKCHHAKKNTATRALMDGTSVAKHGGEVPPSAELDASLSAQKRAPHHLKGPVSGSSEVVCLGAQEGIKSIHLPNTKAFRPMISTIHLSNDECFEYPPTPVIAEGQTRFQCPFCSDELESGSDASKAWKDHIHQDLTPYPCLLPQCADASTFFASRTKWKTHMETRHGSKWVYEVSPNWYCGFGHDQNFNTEWEWRQHMTDTKSHSFTENDLEILVDDMNETVPYSKFLCPLCKKHPKNAEQLLGKDNTSPELISNLLVI